MRETRSSGSVEGVISDGHSYSDWKRDRPCRTALHSAQEFDDNLESQHWRRSVPHYTSLWLRSRVREDGRMKRAKKRDEVSHDSPDVYAWCHRKRRTAGRQQNRAPSSPPGSGK